MIKSRYGDTKYKIKTHLGHDILRFWSLVCSCVAHGIKLVHANKGATAVLTETDMVALVTVASQRKV